MGTGSWDEDAEAIEAEQQSCRISSLARSNRVLSGKIRWALLGPGLVGMRTNKEKIPGNIRETALSR